MQATGAQLRAQCPSRGSEGPIPPSVAVSLPFPRFSHVEAVGAAFVGAAGQRARVGCVLPRLQVLALSAEVKGSGRSRALDPGCRIAPGQAVGRGKRAEMRGESRPGVWGSDRTNATTALACNLGANAPVSGPVHLFDLRDLRGETATTARGGHGVYVDTCRVSGGAPVFARPLREGCGSHALQMQ